MPFKSGHDENRNYKGRPVGATNHTTEEIRKAYQKLTEDNLENMSIWIQQVASENPEKAMDLMIKLSEYVIPKLARTEVTGQDGEDLFKSVNFSFGPDINDKDQRED